MARAEQQRQLTPQDVPAVLIDENKLFEKLCSLKSDTLLHGTNSSRMREELMREALHADIWSLSDEKGQRRGKMTFGDLQKRPFAQLGPCQQKSVVPPLNELY